jgi:hypothetical protein
MRPVVRSTQVPWVCFVLGSSLTVSVAACFPGGTGDAWNAPPFSADLYDLQSPGKLPTQIYIGAGKLRIQSNDPGQTTSFVFDPQHGTTMVIDDRAKTYIDGGIFTPVVAAGAAPLLHLFRPTGDGNPCTAWNATADQFTAFIPRSVVPASPFVCQSNGSDVVAGRAAHKWTLTVNDSKSRQQPTILWIDDRLHVVSRSIDANSRTELRHIKEGAPSADLFVPPAGYHKISVADFLTSVTKATHRPGTVTSAGSTTGDSATDAQDVVNALEKLKGMMKQP